MVEYSEGSLRKIKGGWQGILRYKDDEGRWRTTTKMLGIPCDASSNKGKPAAKKALAAWRASLSATDQKTGDDGELVEQYLRRYIMLLGSSGAIEPSTLSGYLSSLKHIEAGLGGTPLRDLTAGGVQEWEASLTESGFSSATVGKAHRLLKQGLKHAVEAGVILRNPLGAVKPPKRKPPSPNSLDAADRQRLAQTLSGMEPAPLVVGASLALYTGMREGEICGLRWRNVDLERRTLWVREAIGRGTGGAYVKTPKTGGSNRDVPLPEALARTLGARRSTMQNECAAVGIPFSEDLYVIGRVDGSYKDPTALGKEWAALSRALGLVGTQGRKVTFHDLRHTFATVAISSGVDVKTVSSILGHASASMTLNTYASADPDAKRAAARAIDGAMSAAKEA